MVYECSIYIYAWAYNKDLHMPVKTEFEIHNFVTDMPEEKLIEQKWFKQLLDEIEQKHLKENPNCDRFPNAQVGFDHKRGTLKPVAKQATIDEYTLLTKWQSQYGKKFRSYLKRGEKQRAINVS